MQASASLKQYLPDFKKLLKGVDAEFISPVLYSGKYLGHLLEHQNYYLDIYVCLLEKLLYHSSKKKDEIVLIDYGAGNGLLGIFAKYCGFKKVYLADIDNAFIEASKALATQVNIAIDGYCCGDITVLQNTLTSAPDAIVGTDVIEHIYNLDLFFTTLKKINPGMVSVFSTGSNPHNYLKVKRLMRLQLSDEHKGGSPNDFTLFGENAHEPFIRIREHIIRRKATMLNENEILELATATRGLAETDIISATQKYIATKVLPLPPAHPTNTCNPISGSWTERILSIHEYQHIYGNSGFQLFIYNGFFDMYKGGAKAILNGLLNMAVKISGSKLSPFIILVGTKN